MEAQPVPCRPFRRGPLGLEQSRHLERSHAVFTSRLRIFRRSLVVTRHSMQLLAVALALFLAVAPVAAAPVRTAQAQAELLSSRAAWVPGEAQWLGLRILHDPGWHTYWINPGDSGLATRLDWDLPPGFTAAVPDWPRPVRIQIGPLVNFGYEGELLVPVQVTAPKDLPEGGEQTLRVSARWLICEEICIPDGADLEIRLPVASAAAPTPAAPAIEGAAASLPKRWEGGAVLRQLPDGGFELSLSASPEVLVAPELFPADAAFLEHARGSLRWENGTLALRHARSPFFERMPSQPRLLLAAGPGREDPAWWVEPKFAVAKEVGASSSIATPSAQAPALTLWLLALAGAFAGGILLNLMPCVFPVLSLKALSIAESAGEPRRLRRHGLFYTAGVLGGFAVLGAALLALRAAGEAVGWGFQLQQSWFVGFLAWLMFLLGLSLQGVFEIGTRLMGIGGQVAAHGDRGAFLTGLLACVVASPCTAPLMGAALGLAVSLPAMLAMAVFLALGLGMAFPLLALSLTPALAGRLPRPGRWMESFKQAMAFPLYGTALWLLWVLGHQAGVERLLAVLAAALLAVFLIWLGRFGRAARPLRVAGWPLALLLAAWPGGETDSGRASPALGEPFAEATLATARAQGQPVLVNMTADWCITCKVNERVALSGERFAEALRRSGARYLVGDWTREDPVIARYLARYGRNGVPLYVVYPAGGGEPEVLPQILTPRLVEEALIRAASSAKVSAHPDGGTP